MRLLVEGGVESLVFGAQQLLRFEDVVVMGYFFGVPVVSVCLEAEGIDL